MSATIRYGLIGTGMMGLEHQRNIYGMPDGEVVAIADPHEESRQWAHFTADGRALHTFADYRDLLSADICDIYVISTPNMTHRDVVVDVMATGKAILVEKPLCTTIEDATEIRDLARHYPGLVWVGLEYRYMPPVARAIELAHSVSIGELKMLAIREHRHPFLVKVDNWNRFSDNTGGTLVEKCCHFFDLMRLILRSDPVAVMASGGHDVNHLDETYDGRTSDILDNAFVIVEFESGARASLDLSMFADASREHEEVSIVGTTGKIEAFLPSGRLIRAERATGDIIEEVVSDPRVAVEGFHHGASFLEHLDIQAAWRNGSTALVTADDGWWSVVMGVAAHRSIDEKRRVLIAELI
jgi:predicted dehydrogenase